LSQIYKNTSSSGPIPPTVATTYVTDVNSPAVPSANVLNVIGGDTTANTNSGIRTDGSSGSNTLTVQLTNRVKGDITTVNATPTTIITFALGATPGVYEINGSVAAFDVTDTAGASYGFISGIRTTGAAAIEIGTQFTTNFEESAMEPADIDVTVSGNNAIIQVTGIAGKTIDWDALFTYRFVG
jgi:hypothetical protein